MTEKELVSSIMNKNLLSGGMDLRLPPTRLGKELAMIVSINEHEFYSALEIPEGVDHSDRFYLECFLVHLEKSIERYRKSLDLAAGKEGEIT